MAFLLFIVDCHIAVSEISGMEAELVYTVRQPADVTCVALSQSCIASCSSDKAVRVYSMSDFSELLFSPLLHHKYHAVHCAFSANGELLVTCSVDGTTALIDMRSGGRLAELTNPSGKDVRICRISPSASVVATGSIDGVLCIWERASYTLIRSVQAHDESLNACTFSPDGSWLVTGSSRGDLALWDAQYGSSKALASVLDCHDLGVTDCQFSPMYDSADVKKGQRGVYKLATAGMDDNVKLWELCAQTSVAGEVALTCKMTLRGHSRPVYCCCFAPDGRVLASGSCDYTTILWDVSTGRQLHKIADGHTKFVNSCSFSTNGQLLVTASSDKTLKVWRIMKSSSDRAVARAATSVTAAGAEQAVAAGTVPTLKSAPVHYLCPITRELMTDPVVASDGFTYDRSAIENWLSLGRRTSPMTNALLADETLRPDMALAQQIQAYKLDGQG